MTKWLGRVWRSAGRNPWGAGGVRGAGPPTEALAVAAHARSGRHVDPDALTLSSPAANSTVAPPAGRARLIVYPSTAGRKKVTRRKKVQRKKDDGRASRGLGAFFERLVPSRNAATMHPDRLARIPKSSRPEAEAAKPAATIPKKSLFDDSDGSDDGGVQLKVNAEYAKRFEHNKKREERQRRAYIPAVMCQLRANTGLSSRGEVQERWRRRVRIGVHL